MNFSTARRIVFSSAIIFCAAAMAIPALAQRSGGGGGHASASSSAHFGGSGSVSTSSGASHSSSAPSHVTSSNNSVASSSAARPSFATHSSSSSSAGAGLRQASNSSHGASSSAAPNSYTPRNVTIGFPPRSLPVATRRTMPATESARAATQLPRGTHMSFYGDGTEIWAEPSDAPGRIARTKSISAASAPSSKKPLFGNPIATPPLRPRRPIFSGNGFGSGGNNGTRGFGGFFLDPGWGFNSWDACDPALALAQNFGCNSFAYPVNGAVWEPGTTWYSADDSDDAPSCGDPCTNTWQDPPAPDAPTQPAASPNQPLQPPNQQPPQ